MWSVATIDQNHCIRKKSIKKTTIFRALFNSSDFKLYHKNSSSSQFEKKLTLVELYKLKYVRKLILFLDKWEEFTFFIS